MSVTRLPATSMDPSTRIAVHSAVWGLPRRVGYNTVYDSS
jgi:hypothetical protein